MIVISMALLCSYVAYLFVHSLAVLSCSSLSLTYCVAMLPTKGSAKNREEKNININLVFNAKLESIARITDKRFILGKRRSRTCHRYMPKFQLLINYRL